MAQSSPLRLNTFRTVSLAYRRVTYIYLYCVEAHSEPRLNSTQVQAY